MTAIAVIPARMGSSRFPGKPLVSLCNLPMIMHVYFRAQLCRSLEQIVITTPDDEIRKVAESYGAHVIMTSPTHERCTDRVAEAVRTQRSSTDIVVNIQGDEPMLYPDLVDLGVEQLRKNPQVVCAHPVAPIRDNLVFGNRNVIKVVVDKTGSVLYMSREPIPTTVRLGDAIERKQLVVVLAFRRDFLETYSYLPQTPLEQAESVDILRILEHGYRIQTFPVTTPTISVDEPGDVARVERELEKDPLTKSYL